MQSVLRHLGLAAILAVALCACGLSPGGAAAATAHPRIFLSPATLEGLRARAGGGDGDWKALRARCDTYSPSKVEYPDGQEYPDGGAIGEGYQGINYFSALLDVGLCYQVALGIDHAAAERYGAVGASVLEHMSAPKGDPHFQDPNRDDGYGIRFYGAGMAIGYDWLYPALSPALRTRVTESIHTWLASFEKEGFEREFPQGNYFAGYYAAKAYAGMALSGDSPTGDQILESWKRLQSEAVQPYSAANLSGGGWPEGWNYGPLGATNMSLPAVAAKTALGADLVHDPAHPFEYPVANPRYLLYFTWPSMKTLDDSDKTYEATNPTATSGAFFSTEAGVLRAFGDSFAPYFASFAAKVRELEPSGEEGDLWENFLFWDPSAPQAPYTKLPRSYLAKGVEAAAVRSDWSPNAVWGAFKSGPYTNAPEAGWQYFDEGSLAIVNGAKPFLVNAPGALMRDTPGTPSGTEFETKIEEDLFSGDPANRDLFNVFYVDSPTPWGQTAKLRSEGARTQMSGFHDGGSYVAMDGTRLQDMYQGTVKSWSRSVLYLRPGVFVVYDRTKVSDPKIGQWMAFHFAGQPTPVKKGAGAGVERYDVKGPEGYAGTVDTVLPRHHEDTTEGVFGSNKVVRLEIRPGHPGTSQQWLTVFDAAKAPKRAAKVSQLKAKGERAGLLLRRGHGYEAVLLGGHDAKRVSYRLPGGRTTNVVGGLKPGASYRVGFHAGRVTVSLGKGKAADSTGTLAFTTGSKKKKKPKR